MPETLITPEGSPANAAEEPKMQPMSADDFSALEERVLRAVNVVRRERLARSEADERAAQAEIRLAEAETRAAQAEIRATQTEARAALAEARHSEHGLQLESLERDVKQLRAERDQVRERVERLLKQLDTLEL